MKNDTAQVRMATVGQMREIFTSLMQGVPKDLSFEDAKVILGRKTKLILHTMDFFPEFVDDPVKQWKMFYRKVFGVEVDLSKVVIPKRTDEQKKEFTRLVIVLKGITALQTYLISGMKFKTEKSNESYFKGFMQNERNNEDSSYAIWVRDGQESDTQYKDITAKELKKRGIKTETALERLLHGLKYFLETERYLDTKARMLCSGSHYFGNGVPVIFYEQGCLYVWSGTDEDGCCNYSPREVIA